MEDELELDYAQCRRSGEGLANTHAQASAQIQTFFEEVKSYGQPWGMNNAVGQAIGMCYDMAFGLINDCFQSNLDDYTGYPEGLQFMTADYRSAEAESVAVIDKSVKV
ncbi:MULTISPECIES: hypothetical protein [unclassified Streptosporangium]|uniref:hypothetical protein n=1 Tax=unclassified Streptosporangium TaxID=2632669 RepID=UPI002E2AF896|nr:MULTISPECIES: hypothetical protein [unclassified Streptosporangium]